MRKSNSRDGSDGIFKGMAICMIIPWVVIVAIFLYTDIDFDRSIGGRLKRAADANSITIAQKELNAALTEIESRKMTSGSTHVLYWTPETDVEFWYENIKSSRDDLSKINLEKSSLMEQTNVLMKLRETLLDEDESVSVTCPNGIARFPNNLKYAVLLVVTTIFALFGASVLIAKS